ncbi:MAG: cytidine deaminase [Candidatus Moranbacteria bacterium]|nr:cytidine deaminase [Candidatus Moranbacteria bacterium]
MKNQCETLIIKTGRIRPTWEETWFKITQVIKKRSVCLYYQVGAVIVKDKQFLSMGYNGPPIGISHCTDVGCAKIINGELKKHQGLCRGGHAEINAIANAASLGVKIKGSDLFVTYRPCLMCSKAILNAGIKRVFFFKDYDGDQQAWELFQEADIIIKKIKFKT